MSNELMQEANEYLMRHYGVSLDTLLMPISAQAPTGVSLLGQSEYNQIQKARKADDPTLPLGSWTYELKRADWVQVGKLVTQALLHRSKDLQLAAWLLEAQIHRHGLGGIAPCLMLMAQLCDRYWPDVYPQPDQHGLEHRANVMHWVNDKLLPTMRLAPLTLTSDGVTLSCADWELAQRNEKVRTSLGQSKEQTEGINLSEFAMAMAGTPADTHLAHHHYASSALAALAILQETCDGRFGPEGPLFNDLRSLLSQIESLISNELRKRGLQTSKPAETSIEVASAPSVMGQLSISAPLPVSPLPVSPLLRDRADAYALLSTAADYLAQIEPHSPAPYLVRRAIKWGNLDTAELYNEVFLRSAGQISIFELLGLQSSDSVEQTEQA